jgi:hypothetical protein
VFATTDGTQVTSNHKMDELERNLREQWKPAAKPPATAGPGTPIALLRVPKFGADWEKPVVEGVDKDELARGIGHYPETQLPGQPGNFAVAGHREHMLGHLKSALEAARDLQALQDLNQLWGLCDRADAEAMLPLAPEEVASDRGQRHYEFCDVVDRMVDQLVPETLSTKRLKAVGGKGYYGRWVRAGSGHEMQIAVLSWSWGTRYPTPWWIRFPRPDAELEKAVRTLTDDPRFPLIEVDGDLMALAESPQVCSSVFLTWWRGYCSGRRVPVVACRSVSARAWWWRSR